MTRTIFKKKEKSELSGPWPQFSFYISFASCLVFFNYFSDQTKEFYKLFVKL